MGSVFVEEQLSRPQVVLTILTRFAEEVREGVRPTRHGFVEFNTNEVAAAVAETMTSRQASLCIKQLADQGVITLLRDPVSRYYIGFRLTSKQHATRGTRVGLPVSQEGYAKRRGVGNTAGIRLPFLKTYFKHRRLSAVAENRVHIQEQNPLLADALCLLEVVREQSVELQAIRAEHALCAVERDTLKRRIAELEKAHRRAVRHNGHSGLLVHSDPAD